jgi:hypothetical protein
VTQIELSHPKVMRPAKNQPLNQSESEFRLDLHYFIGTSNFQSHKTASEIVERFSMGAL